MLTVLRWKMRSLFPYLNLDWRVNSWINRTQGKWHWGLPRLGHKRQDDSLSSLSLSPPPHHPTPLVACSGKASHHTVWMLKLSGRESHMEKNRCLANSQYQLAHYVSKMEINPLVFIKPTDDCSPKGCQLQPHMRPWARTTYPNHFPIPDPQGAWEITHDYYGFKLLSFGMICYITKNDARLKRKWVF